MKHLNKRRLALAITGAIAIVLGAVISCIAILALTGTITRGLSGIYGLATVLLCCTVVFAMILEDKL